MFIPHSPKNKMLILDNSEKPATPKRQIVGKKGRAARQKGTLTKLTNR